MREQKANENISSLLPASSTDSQPWLSNRKKSTLSAPCSQNYLLFLAESTLGGLINVLNLNSFKQAILPTEIYPLET